MYCLQCGTQLSESARFCCGCGTAHVVTQTSTSTTQKSDSHKSKGIITLLILLVALVVSGVAYLIVRIDAERKKSQVQNQTSQPQEPAQIAMPPVHPQAIDTPIPVVKRTSTLPIGQGSFTIEPSQDSPTYFSIYDAGDLTKIIGRFKARGGSGNDVEVLLLTKEGYENWANGHSCQQCCFYQSGRVTTGHLDVSLPTGDYVLVFSNKFSVFSSKIVDSDIKSITNP